MTDAAIPRTDASTVRWFAIAAGGALAAILLLAFHDHGWWPRDDGYYAHIADRLLEGAVLHRDVQGLHAGYVYALDAVALWLFGPTMASLRIPLVIFGVVQAVIAARLIAGRSTTGAVIAGGVSAALSVTLFASPTVHWYGLFLCVALAAVLAAMPRDHPWRPAVVGFLVAMTVMFRQLTGVLLGIGVLSYLLVEGDGERSARDRRLARGLIATAFAGLAVYLAANASTAAWVLFGTIPLAMLALAWRSAASGAGNVPGLLAKATLGGVAAVLPAFLYHSVNGSLDAWFGDAVAAAIGLTGFEYVQSDRYMGFAAHAAMQLLTWSDPARMINGVFWAAMLTAPAILGAWMLYRTARSATAPHPLPYLAIFYALVAVHYESPSYLYFAAVPVMLGLLWCLADRPAALRRAGFAAIALIAGLAVVNHSGLPRSADLMSRSAPVMAAPEIARLGLRIPPEDRRVYVALLRLIDEHSLPGDGILGVPAAPELNFLSKRRSPLPYPYLSYGVVEQDALISALETLRRDPPRLVFHIPRLPYNTSATNQIMDWVEATYRETARVGDFVVYRRDH